MPQWLAASVAVFLFVLSLSALAPLILSPLASSPTRETSLLANIQRLAERVLVEYFPIYLALLIGIASLTEAGGRVRLLGTTVVDQVTGVWWFSLVSGLTSMAIIEVAKRLFGLRGTYQQHQIRGWLRGRAPNLIEGEAAYRQLVNELGSIRQSRLSLYGRASRQQYLRRLFDLPIEQITAQVRLAMDMAVIDPERYYPLVSCITGRFQPNMEPPDAEQFEIGSSELELAHDIRAGVDALQIFVGESWRRYVRASAVWVSGFVGMLLADYADLDADIASTYTLASLVLGGVLSWLSRDVMAVVEKLRR